MKKSKVHKFLLGKASLKAKNKNRQLSLFIISLLLLSIVGPFNFLPCKTQPILIIVPDQYSTIQEAINNANEGDTIFVSSGIYYENVVVNKTVSLVGEDSSTTIIDGNGAGIVIHVARDAVNVTGFFIRESGGWPEACIGLDTVKDCSISANVVDNNNKTSTTFVGIFLQASEGNTVTGNDVRNNHIGINIRLSSNNAITENRVAHAHLGIQVCNSSNGNRVSENNLTNCELGVAVNQGSQHNSVFRNLIERSNETGIGIGVSSNNNLVVANAIADSFYGIRVLWSSNNTLYHNRIMDNNIQAYVTGGYANKWDNGYPSGGNHWSNYAGIDANNDGLGDTPYVINAYNQDCYPLMHPWSSLPVHNINTGSGYATIQEAINAAKTGNAIFVESGLYCEHITVNKTVQLVGENPATTIIYGNMTGTLARVTSDNVSITGFMIRAGQNTHPICNVWLENVSQCRIHDNILTHSFYGVYLNESNSNSVYANRATNLSIGICGFQSDRNLFCGNEFAANSFAGINLHLCRFNNITENLVDSSSTGVRLLEGAENNTLVGNTITANQYGIHIFNARYTEILNNTIAHNYGSGWDAGIRLDSAGYSEIHSNLITDNWRGILLYTSSPYVSIYNNNITDSEFGVRVSSGGSHYLNVSDNIVMNSRGYGVGLTAFSSGSHYATITRNLIVNNSDGIALGQYSNYNTISQNNISKNGNGFYIEYSTRNTIFHNNIVDNDQQVNATSAPNAWDGGFPTGGNYWSDYRGIDAFNGLGQNLTGSDGIGDTPYAINADSSDNFPLMKPYGVLHDIGITSIAPHKTVVGQGYSTDVDVRIVNYGVNAETLNVTVYVNTTAIATFADIFLLSRNASTLSFKWHTTGLLAGNYTLEAVATVVAGETCAVDNTANCTVKVTIPGDVDGDFYVNVTDATQIGSNWMRLVPPAPANADINGDGIINIKDATIIGTNWLQHA